MRGKRPPRINRIYAIRRRVWRVQCEIQWAHEEFSVRVANLQMELDELYDAYDGLMLESTCQGWPK